MTPKKILLISHELSLTGAPLMLLSLAKIFRAEGFLVTVWSFQKGPLEKDFQQAGCTVRQITDRNWWYCLWGKRQAARFDFIAANTIMAYRAVLALGKIKTPLIWYLHETVFIEEIAGRRPKILDALRLGVPIYTVSGLAQEYLRSHFGADSQILPTFIPDVSEQTVPLSAGKLNIGFLGSFSPEKGADLLVEAYLLLPEEIQRQVSLHLAGERRLCNQSFWEPLQNRTKEKPVIWYGKITGREKEKFFQTINLLAVPSRYDSASLVLLEGCRAGLPIITSGNTGNKTFVDPQNGWITETGNPQALADALLDAWKWRGELPQMGTVSRKRFLERADWNAGRRAVLKMLAEIFPSRSSQQP